MKKVVSDGEERGWLWRCLVAWAEKIFRGSGGVKFFGVFPCGKDNGNYNCNNRSSACGEG